jgi:hypothetical protein
MLKWNWNWSDVRTGDLPFLSDGNIGKSARALVPSKSLFNLVDGKIEKTVSSQLVSGLLRIGKLVITQPV